ncbi:MAG: hypothetical protein MUC41_11915 [Syntrophobacteraceae bacterium]|nr:hypothetical protein [Syntrophobacteraceae bacterium]
MKDFKVVTVGAPEDLFMTELAADMGRLREDSLDEHGIVRKSFEEILATLMFKRKLDLELSFTKFRERVR